MKNTTIKNFIALGTLAVILMSSHSALAYVPGVWDPQPRTTVMEPAFTKVPTTYDAPVTPQVTTPVVAQPTKTVAQNTTKPTASTNTNKAVAVRNTNTANQGTVYGPTTNTGAMDQSVYPYGNTNVSNGSELTALSLNGSGSFMPSSVWQWFIVIFLILVIVIISRMLTRGPEHHNVHSAAH